MKLIDLHCDTASKLMENKNIELYSNELCVDIKKLIKAESLAQFFALFIDSGRTEDPLKDCLAMLQILTSEISKNKNHISLAKSYEDLIKNIENNIISAFITIEEGAVLKGQPENLKMFYDSGVRLITLTWNYPNELGFPNNQEKYRNQGLTAKGIEIVEDMNNLGMIIDVSHLSDKGFYDVADLSSKPFAASHSNCRSITGHPRNLTDDMIRLLAEKGGIMGINFEPSFLGSSKTSRIKDMISHISHIRKVGGVDVISVGSDFDGTYGYSEIKNIGDMELLKNALEKEGFTFEEIEKFFYKNALRLIKDTL